MGKLEEAFQVNKKGKLDITLVKKTRPLEDPISEAQVKILEDSFKISPFPDNIDEICQKTKMSEIEVKKWFVRKTEDSRTSRIKKSGENSNDKNYPKPSKEIVVKEEKSNFKENSRQSTKEFNFSPQQFEALKLCFNQKTYPTAGNYKKISSNLGIDKELVIK